MIDRRATPAALGSAILTVAALVTGVFLLQAIGGGQSGQDVGANAAAAARPAAMPLLVLAELLKIATAACQSVVVQAARPAAGPWRLSLAAMGHAGALLIAASGLAGLYAVASGTPELGPATSVMGFAGLAVSGAWVIALVSRSGIPLPRWVAVVGLTFGTAALLAIALAPLAMLAGLLSIVWFGLWRALASIK